MPGLISPIPLAAPPHQRPRIVMHVDMDSFYASVERRENPVLQGLPLIIGADPKGGFGRGVVAACSYEARRVGVHSAQPISKAFGLCPNGVYLRPNFPLYERVSGEVMEFLRGFADGFEQVSVDEAFLDVSERVKGFGEASELAKEIKRELRSREGLTCSIGVAPNKSVAKIASDLQKPDGLSVVEPWAVRGFLAPLPVSRMNGVGSKTEGRLRSLGVQTIGQLAELPVDALEKEFGKNGLWMWLVANGVDESEVQEGEARSICAERTFETDVEERRIALEAVRSLAEDVHQRLLAEGLLFRTVGIKVRFQDFETYTRSRSCPAHVNRLDVVTGYAASLFREFEGDERRVRLVGVRVANLRRGAERKLLMWT